MKNRIIIGFIIICTVLSITSCVSKQDKDNADTIKAFLYRVKKQDLNSRQIIDTFMMKNPSSAYIKLQELYIPFLKQELKETDIESLKIAPYSNASKKYQTILNEDKKNIYIILYKNSVFHYILMDGKRIKSFSTMNFGSDNTAKKVFTF
ncbi:hypothetical protein A4C53_RS08120 [Elizabethkingia anophelis]|uniref:hypothetical protein n=1 Tax=Elizabethkingia TaxID=308865 RepID=UPI0004653C7D|nr:MULTISPECIES: hypothetical protein [Elizabethkingia]AMR41255.1 hypothetical protein A2T74_07725 [Elizabethkingia anophelis]AMX47896.1 hypothetical protein A4C56_07725 [Elizabethkingia anophelis]AMX51352.1 hypothetical protein A2T72_07725 [Elizabethkingia anophelis]AMX54747.1 hypothetical protein A2T59_07725 [Elizabethkingia anophelis]EGT4346523.1 hypothetical protein [Elizabethkingia anophelis]